MRLLKILKNELRIKPITKPLKLKDKKESPFEKMLKNKKDKKNETK